MKYNFYIVKQNIQMVQEIYQESEIVHIKFKFVAVIDLQNRFEISASKFDT